MEQTGRVISDDKGIAVVELVRESACSSCHHKDACGAKIMGGCAKSERVTVKANNLCNAEVGDEVKLNSNSAKMLGISFCVFILPLLLTFAAYLICEKTVGLNAVGIIITASVFFISFFALFFGFDKLLCGKVNINITEIIAEKNDKITE